MVAPLTALSRAIKTPYTYFRAQLMMMVAPRYDEGDNPAVVCVGDHAEAQVKLAYGQRALLYMPLTEDTFAETSDLVRWIRRTSTPIFDDCQALREEMLFFDIDTERYRADIILQRLPEGCYLHEVRNIKKQRLRAMLDELQVEMQRLNITHTNLTPHCIIVGKERMHLARIHQIRRGEATTNFRPLYAFIDSMDNDSAIREVAEWKMENLSKIERVYELHEERMRIMIDGKYGFSDVHQNIIIDAKYLWVEDFKEGRSIVRTESGMGVIDRVGQTIIEPHFENVTFEVDKGFFRAVEDGRFRLFNYDGEEFDELDEERFGSDIIREKSPRDIYLEIKKEERRVKRRQKREIQREIERLLCNTQNV